MLHRRQRFQRECAVAGDHHRGPGWAQPALRQRLVIGVVFNDQDAAVIDDRSGLTATSGCVQPADD